MKQKWLLILIAGILIFALTGCAKADSPLATAEQSQAAADQTAETSADEQADTGSDTDADAGQDDDTNSDTASEEQTTIDAAAIFAQRCASCHGANREGRNGPALLPERLTKDASVYNAIITDGSGPMPSWGSRLSAEEINALVEFILSNPE